MDLQALRDHIRNYLDIEVDEVSDGMLDSYLREGYRRIVRFGPSWSWLQKEWVYQVPDGWNKVAFGAGGLEDARTIDTVVYNLSDTTHYLLEWMDHAEATRCFSGTVVSRPTRWSRLGTDLYVWPQNGGVTDLTLTGQREPTDWVTAGAAAEPDCPRDFDLVLAKWAIAAEAQRQEDMELATYHRTNFTEDLQILWNEDSRMPAAAPLVIGGDGSRMPARYEGLRMPY